MFPLLPQLLPYLPALARLQDSTDNTPPILCYSILGMIIILLVYSLIKSANIRQLVDSPQKIVDKKDYRTILAALRFRASRTDEKSVKTRAAAAKALLQLAPQPASTNMITRIVSALIQAAADQNSDVRAAAVPALGMYAARTDNANLRGRAVAALRDRLADPVGIRLAAVQSMGRITSAWALEPIAAANRENNPEAAKHPLAVLSSLNKDLGPGLFNLFSQPGIDTPIRAAAAQALGAFALVDPAALNPLQSALGTEKNEEIRHAAIRGVGATAHPRAIEILVGRLGKVVPSDRAVIASALEQHGWKPADPRAAAAFAAATGRFEELKTLGQPAIEQLAGDLQYCGSANLSTVIPETLASFGKEALPFLLPPLDDPNVTTRKYAAITLGKIGAACRDPRIAAGLEKLLDDKEPQVVEAALDALEHTADPQSAPALASYLARKPGQMKSEHREAAFAVLQKIGQPAIPALIPLLEDNRAHLRERAAQALKYIGWQPGMDETGAKYWIILREYDRCTPIGELAVRPLIQVLGSEKPEVVPQIVPVLSTINSPSTLPLLVALINDKSAQAIMNGLAALGVLADPRAVNPLANFLKMMRDNVQYRDGALSALQNIGLPAAPALIPLLDDAIVSFRECVARTLKSMDWQPSLDASGAYYWIALQEFERCAAIGEAAVRPLVQALVQKGPESSQVIVPVLAVIDSPSTTPLLLDLLNENDNQAVLSGLGALEELADPRAVNPLVNFLKKTHDNVQYRKGALAALQEIGQPAIPELVALLDEPSVVLREEAAQALRRLDWKPSLDEVGAKYWVTLEEFGRCAAIGEAAVQPLVRVLAPETEKHHDVIFAVLRQIGRPAMPALTALLSSGSRSIREKAALALQDMDWQPGPDEDGANYWINLRQVERCVPIGEPAISPLVRLLGSRWEEERRAAADALVAIGGSKVAAGVIPLLRLEEIQVTRFMAATVLNKIGWVPSSDEDGANYWITRGKVNHCVEIGSPAVPALLAALDKLEEGTGPIIQALGTIGDPRAAGPLVNIAFSSSGQKGTARAQLKNFGPAIIKPLIPHLQDSWYDDRRFAAEVLLDVYTHTALSDNDRALLLQQRAAITEPRLNNYNHTDYGHSESWSSSNDCGGGHEDNHGDSNIHADRGIGLPFAEK